MSEPSAVHATFVVERIYNATPQRVFAAFSSAEGKGRWFIGPDGWKKSNHQLDFRVGGRESLSGGPPGGPTHYFSSQFYDIVENERIVSVYEMHLGDKRISVSISTVEIMADGEKTTLKYTEQGVFLDGLDAPGDRIKGTNDLFDKLDAEIAG